MSGRKRRKNFAFQKKDFFACVSFVSDAGHVMGDIAVTRALGDVQFSPYVTNEPSIFSWERTGGEVLAIIAVNVVFKRKKLSVS